jgi:hypothetical protein
MVRPFRLALLLGFFAGGLEACRSPQSQVEPGAALIHVKTAPGTPVPDSLRVWAYDDSGILWNGERVPKDGSLVPVSTGDLGTIFLQPGSLQGALRIHVVGMQESTTVSGGVLSVPSLAAGTRTFDLWLSADAPVDTDGDGVPDSIDNCPVANPLQQTCPEAPTSDGGADGPPPAADAVSRDELPPPADGTSPSDGLADQIGAEDVAKDALAADAADGQAARPEVTLGPEVGNRDITAEDPESADVAPEVASPPDLRNDSSIPGDGPPPPDAAIGCGDASVCGKAQGISCARNDECASGQCADGVCCTNSCVGACRSCNQPNAVGVCQGYAAGTDPEHECGTGLTCNGAGACGAPPSNLSNGQLCTGGSQCSSRFCKDGVCCNSACNEPCQTCGTGTCLPVKRTDDVPECTGVMTCNARGSCVGR